MTPTDAFAHFAKRVLVPSKAERFIVLASSKKGKRKVLEALCHDFEAAVLKSAIQYRDRRSFQNNPCFAFHTSCGFGASFPSFSEAYDNLSLDDGWLILGTDGSFGVYRPESRWDAEVVIAA